VGRCRKEFRQFPQDGPYRVLPRPSCIAFLILLRNLQKYAPAEDYERQGELTNWSREFC
jgi:hypothetical protein